MTILALCPSRGRPDAARAVAESFGATATVPGTRLVFLVDDNDPTLPDYPRKLTRAVKPLGSYVPILNAACKDPSIIGDATVIGMIGDDNRFRTKGWDRAFLDALPPTRPGIAYGDDGLQHERLPTSWWVSRQIVDAFGLAEPTLRHYYSDNVWLDLGRECKCITYLPDVHIEHLHPLAGKAEVDELYAANHKHVTHDKAAYRNWTTRLKPAQVQRLKTIVRGATPRRVLADWHHPTLWESLRILFEDRLGWELYSPLGAEWCAAGWAFQGGTPGWTTDDYLVHPAAMLSKDGTHYSLLERDYPAHPRKLVTVAQAQASQWDFVLCSVPVHQRPFGQMARSMGAKLIHQVGNARHSVDPNVPQIILASANLPRESRRHRQIITYHQEFDQAAFAYCPPRLTERDVIRVGSFMLRIDSTSGPYEWLASSGDIKFEAHGGADPRNGTYLHPHSKVADAMAWMDWIWHDKTIGDGYGHVLHNAASLGRPLIGHASFYKGLLGEPYWRDMETCIDLDKHPPERALRLIRAISADPEWMAEMSRTIRAEFDARVNFSDEAARIREVLLA